MLRKFSPALRWIFQYSPSALMMPLPVKPVRTGPERRKDRRNEDWERSKAHTKKIPCPPLHKLPFAENPFILEYVVHIARIADQNPRGSVGTDSARVSYPNLRSHLVNHVNSFWRAWRK